MRIGLSLIFICFLAGSYIVMANPFKITDPADPRFDPDSFSFSDYASRDELIHVYKTIFPIGTPKPFVDRVLVTAGGAQCAIANKSIPDLYYCRQPRTLHDWDTLGAHFTLIFDDQMRLLNINPNGLGEIYPHSVTTNPFKVTDPTDPRYNPDSFSFKDNMLDRDAKIETFRALFPPGTPKTFVDRVLVGAGGARLTQTKDLPGLWHYSEPRTPGLPNGPVHTFIFTRNEQVENVYVFNTDLLYPSRTTLKQLKQQRYGD